LRNEDGDGRYLEGNRYPMLTAVYLKGKMLSFFKESHEKKPRDNGKGAHLKTNLRSSNHHRHHANFSFVNSRNVERRPEFYSLFRNLYSCKIP